MALISDLIQPQALGWRPQGGPLIPVLPKAQSNAMGTSIGVGPQPKTSTPAEMLAALTGVQTAQANIALTDAQKQEILAKLALIKQNSSTAMPSMYGDTQTPAAPTGAAAARAAEASPNGPDIASLSDPRGLVPYIRQAAEKNNIDPDTAVRVAASEGLANPVGDGGKSGGAFQLYTGGGVGNEFQKDTGLDPLDLNNEKATIDYALAHAAKNGWGAWNGAKGLGITGFMGIGKPTAPTQLASAAPMTMNDASPGLSPIPSADHARPPSTPLSQLEQSLRERLGLAQAAPNEGPVLPPSGAGTPVTRDQLIAQLSARPTAQGPAGAPLTPDQQNARLLLAQQAGQQNSQPGIAAPGGPTQGRQPTQAWVDWARGVADRDAWLGRATPAWIVEGLQMAPGGSKSPDYLQGSAGATAAGQFPSQAALKQLEGNIYIQNELAKEGKKIVNGVIVPIPGNAAVLESNAAATERGKASGGQQTTQENALFNAQVEAAKRSRDPVTSSPDSETRFPTGAPWPSPVGTLPAGQQTQQVPSGGIAPSQPGQMTAGGVTPSPQEQVIHGPDSAAIAFNKSIAEGTTKDFFARQTAARGAERTLTGNIEARKLLDAGIITGTGADFKVSLGKAAQQLGFHMYDDAISNSEAYKVARANETANLIKAFGTGNAISNSDLLFANRMAAGELTFNEASLRKILDLADRYAHKGIDEYNADAKRIDPKLSPYPLTIEKPEPYQAPGIPSGAQPIGTYKGKPVYQMPDGSRKVLQ